MGALISKFGVKEPVLDTFLPLSVYKSILAGTSKGDSVADGAF